MAGKKYNISVIVLDTLRLDEFRLLEAQHMSLHRLGFKILNNCIAPSSWTLPSHASLFTGLYPSKHGAHETAKIKSLDIQKIKLKKPTILKNLAKLGYKSYGISANPYINPIYGFNEFDFFHEESYFTDIFGSVVEVSDSLKPRIAEYRNIHGNDLLGLSASMIRNDPNLFLEALGSAALRTPGAAVKKLKAKFIEGWPIEKGGRKIITRIRHTHFKEPFFLFANLMEAHDPYIGKRGRDFNWATPFLKSKPDDATVQLWKRLYSKAALKAYAYAVELIRDLITRYGDRQVIILTSDHGQAFNEHGFIGHGTVLHDEAVRIPLAVLLPGKFYRSEVHGFCSLVNVEDFILRIIKGDRDAFGAFDNKAVYAESFGVPANISMVPGIDTKKIKAMDKVIRRRFSL